MKRSKEERGAVKARKKIDSKIWQLCSEYFAQNPKAILVDVGAFTGAFENSVNPLGKMVLVEPNPGPAADLRSKFPQAVVVEAAVGKEPKPIVCMYQSVKYSGKDASLWFESANKNDLKLGPTFVVTQKTMDEIYAECSLTSVDILFLNCEGGEYEIFEGPTKFLEVTKMVYIHLHTKCALFRSKEYREKRKRIGQVLRDAGFTMTYGMDNLDSIAHIVQLWRRM